MPCDDHADTRGRLCVTRCPRNMRLVSTTPQPMGLQARRDMLGAGLRSVHHAVRQSSPGMIRAMNWSNIGTVKAVSPWFGLQIMPLEIN